MDTNRLTKIANIVDAKGLHTLADKIDDIIQECVPEVQEISLEEAIAYYDSTKELTEVADSLDRQGVKVAADQLDHIIELEALEQQSAIDAILTVYKRKHVVASAKPISTISFTTRATIRKDNLPKEQRCPFGLPIPNGCLKVGSAIGDMEERKEEHKQNKRIFKKYQTGKVCPYAAAILKKRNAVNCTYGTEIEGKETPKMYRGSPIYPKLFEGFNTINLDRNYYQYHDFGYYSLYGP